MQRFFSVVIEPLLDMIRPARIIEVGSANGGHSRLLATWCRAHGAFVDVVDPAPRYNVATFEAEFDGHLRVHAARSLDVLGSLPRAEVVLIDGDHNWYTVYHELQALVRDGGPLPLVALHDVDWPYGRRDLYYNPTDVPEAYRQPWKRAPMQRGQSALAEAGLNPHLCNAVTEGGPRNGVLTAVEDFVNERPDDYRLCVVNLMFGLAILFPKAWFTRWPELEGFVASLDAGARFQALTRDVERQWLQTVITQQAAGLRREALEAGIRAQGRTFDCALDASALEGIQAGTLAYRYRGVPMLKSPFDLATQMRLLFDLRPRTVIEVGTFLGGSALWYADMLSQYGVQARVITIDHERRAQLDDPRVTFLQGDARALGETLPDAMMRSLAHPMLVIEDSTHTREMSLAVLEFFDGYLEPGDCIVVEDGVLRNLPGEAYAQLEDGPSRAIEAFLSRRGDGYAVDVALCDAYGRNVTWNPNGYLRRR